MSVRNSVLVAAALLVAGTLPGCGGACAELGDQIQVRVNGGADLNDAGSGAQHARFKVWAVKDPTSFNSQPAASLAKGEVDAVAMNAIGREFPSESNWLTPGGVKTLLVSVDQEEQYSHVGVAVLYPTPQKKLVRLCQSPATKEDGTHRIVFIAGKNSITTGAAATQ